MSDRDDQLIAEFNARRSEDAFAALVRQHVNLVFATALRQVGDAGAAEEITQNVFVALAQAASKLRSHPTIAGWLHQTALNKSREWLRSELRRRKREQVAVNLQLDQAEGDSVWAPLVPLLDEALLKLREPDRQAVMLHYMEGCNFQEVGSALGVGEDAARKRVNRCLNELTDFFRHRGFAVPALSAGAPLFAISSHVAPAGLAASATTAGLAAAHSAASASTLTLIKEALKIMAWTKAKTAIVVGVGILVATGTTTITVKEIQDHRVYEWQKRWQGAAIVNKVPPQVAIRPSPSARPSSVQAWGTSNGKMVGLGYDFIGMVKGIYQIDPEHLLVSVPVPSGKFDWIANLSTPSGNNFGLNDNSLQAAIKKHFGLQIRREYVETNVLLLTLRSRGAPGLKPHPESWQQGPQVTKKSISFQGGTWLLVQALENSLGTIVVDRTGLSKYYNVNLKWDGTSDGLKRALRRQLGMDLAPSDGPVAVPMYVVEKARKPAVNTMVETADVRPDGIAQLQVTVKHTNTSVETLSEDYIDGISSLPIDGVVDETGQPMKFRKQSDYGGILIVTLGKPVPPGGQFSYTVDLTVTNLIQRTSEPGVFECQRNIEPSSECVTHSIEDYRLPAGAVVLSKHSANLKATTNGGRIDLRIDRMIQPDGVQETRFRYRLAAANH